MLNVKSRANRLILRVITVHLPNMDICVVIKKRKLFPLRMHLLAKGTPWRVKLDEPASMVMPGMILAILVHFPRKVLAIQIMHLLRENSSEHHAKRLNHIN